MTPEVFESCKRQLASARQNVDQSIATVARKAALVALTDEQRADQRRRQSEWARQRWAGMTKEQQAEQTARSIAKRSWPPVWTDESRSAVGSANAKHWRDLSDEERKVRIEKSSAGASERTMAQWASIAPDARRAILMPAIVASRRANPSSIERAACAMLDALGIEYVANKRIGKYVVDLLVPNQMLVVECDGSYWHSLPGMPEKDARRDAFFVSLGYRVIRIGESEFKSSKAKERLLAAVGAA